MKLLNPNPELPYVRVESILDTGERANSVCGGDKLVEVDDRAVEVLLKSFNPQGRQECRAWTKALGYVSVEAYVQMKKDEQELTALRAERKERVKKQNEKLPPTKNDGEVAKG